MLTIKKIMYKPPATIVFWNDGTKTVAVCEKGDVYNRELGFALCVLKKKYGNKKVHDMLDKYVHKATKYSKSDGAMVWESEPAEKKAKKPNGGRKRVRVHHKPDRYLELKPDRCFEFTLEPVKNDPTHDLLEELFNDFYNFL